MNEWEKIRRQLLAELVTIDRIIDAVECRPKVALEMLHNFKAHVMSAVEYAKTRNDRVNQK